ncbi:GTPase HflX [Paenibacillus albicereus]|uniref:GTPase HflX n=1 Tax=Paenibacillus albicereus TaxID=2726185 RepID=A0A6H2GTM9_9BACL|nr:GTPase HflX [Paenibacillus albicereus]QJC50508.1 GTPase HflX [Paenibacillus albicereus]
MTHSNQHPRERAILVGVHEQNNHQFAYSMQELQGLAEACNIEVVAELTQKAERIHSTHYLGSGKLEELAALMEAYDSPTVICNDELSPSQIRNLEAAVKTKVIDRTIVILDIFAERAQTKEAQLQVEVARLNYMLPRLVGLRESLGRQGGGGGAGLRNRGAGETKLELDRRRIEERIHLLETELEKLVHQRQVQRKRRKKNEIPVLALVGYTNAGKSTLLNALVDTFHPDSGKNVLAKDMLFATLETSVRSIELPDRKSFLLTDTVGFVSGLPHHLIKAFRSTLEEVAEADLLVHVVDSSNPEFKQQIEVTEQTLKELGADGIPMLYAFNKADLAGQSYPRVEQDRVYLSAYKREGVDELVAQIRKQIFRDYIAAEVVVPFDQGAWVSFFNEHAHVQETEYEEAGTRLKLEVREADLNRFYQETGAERQPAARE